MQDLTFEVDIGIEHDFVALFFGLGENDGSVAFFAGIAENEVSDGIDSIEIVAVDGQVLHFEIGLVFGPLKHINKVSVRRDELLFDFFDPGGVSS